MTSVQGISLTAVGFGNISMLPSVCRVDLVACFLHGSDVGVDASLEQVKQARFRAADSSLKNITFVEGKVAAPTIAR